MRSTFALLLLALLGACGGGGGGGGTAGGTLGTSIAFSSMVDSFGRSVGRSEGYSDGDAGGDGSAGDGAPIANGVVLITDAKGTQVSATTDAYGYFRVKLTGLTPPFVAQVTKTDLSVRYSLNTKQIKTNGFITINFSPLTDKIASDVAIADGKTGASQLTTQGITAHSGAIATSIAGIAANFSSIITRAGLITAAFDPLSTPYISNHTGYDNVLDNTVLSYSGTGGTQLAAASTYVPPLAPSPVTKLPVTFAALAGTWQVATTTSGTTIPTSTVPGTEVPPSAAAWIDFYWISDRLAYDVVAAQAQGFSETYQNVTTNATGFGFTRTLSGLGSSSVFTNSYVLTSYTGCGACGVGSTVTVVSTGNSTGTSTTGGVTTPSGPNTFLITTVYTRLQ